MNIAVDAFPLACHLRSGIPNYVYHVMAELSSIDMENRYFLYSFSDFDFPAGGNTVKKVFYNKRGKGAGGFTWFSTLGVRDMAKNNMRVFWGTRYQLPFFLPRRVGRVLTVHDLVWRYFPETMERYNLINMKLFAERSIRAADRIIAVSHATARSVMSTFGTPAEKISVIHHGAGQYSPLDRKGSAEYISEKYGTNRDYALTVSTVEPRKNLKLLLRVFSGLRDEGPQLLVAGAPGWKTSSVRGEYDRLGLTEREVKFLGYVPDEDMNRLYSGALLFVFPSVYEGFGIPPLEAMASGTPVIVSGASSLPEVVGDAGMLLDPNDEGGWAEAIVRVAGDGDLRERMGRMGLERAGLFSWKRAAEKTLDIFKGVA